MPFKLPSSHSVQVHLQNQTSLRDEEPYGPSNMPEPAGQTSMLPNEMLAQGLELEARFEELMAGPGGSGNADGNGGMRSEVRDWALGLV